MARLSPGQRRAVILDAARQAFIVHGFEGASMRRIAGDSGVTTPVLYDHFPSKQALYLDLLEEEANALVEATDTIETNDSVDESIAAAVDAFFGLVQRRPIAWRLLMRNPPGDPVIAERHRELQQRGNQAIAHALERIPAFTPMSGAEDPSLREARAVAVRAMVNGLASWWWDHPDIPQEDLTSLAAAILNRGVPGTFEDLPRRDH